MDEFQKFADNGDLMLFRSKNIGTKLQRAVTRSQFDHVGMIVLWETSHDVNTVYLLEAVSDEGVRLVEFIPNIDWYFEVYDQIVYRPLQNVERNEDLLGGLDEHLEEVLGKKYSISLKKLWRHSINLKNSEGRFTEHVDRTFQWAELVAKMYKVLGLLSPEEHSGKYLPVHFTDKKEINLLRGKFGPQCVIKNEDQ
jgi:hypothetical protein